MGKELGNHTVTVSLKYGYKWENAKDAKDDTSTKTLTCEIKAPKVRVDYDVSDCNKVGKQVVYKGTYGDLCAPTKKGYSFLGWYTSNKFLDKDKVDNKSIVEDWNRHTLYAKWKPNTYTINFNGNGATSGSTAPKTCIYDQNCVLTSNGFTRKGYTFAGWKLGANSYKNEHSVRNLTATNNGTVTLNAQWTANTYTVKFDGNGATGGNTASKKCTYDQNCALTANGFTRRGYTFAGWAYGPTNPTSISDKQSVGNLTTTNNGTVTLYAKWKPKIYTVKLNGNYSDQEPGTPDTGRPDYPTTWCTFGQNCTPPIPSFTYTKGGYHIYAWSLTYQPKKVGNDDKCKISNINGHPANFKLDESVIDKLDLESDDIVLWACWEQN